jgi:MazG family protein
LKRWDEIKRGEKGNAHASVMDGISPGLPALLHAEKLQKRAAKVGFDWPDAAPVAEKVREELNELSVAAAADHEEELGDVLFSVVNLARKLKINPETALSRATRKFETRFRAVEQLALARSLEMEQMTLPELDALWAEVKRSAAE